jgi:hypothetical protein
MCLIVSMQILFICSGVARGAIDIYREKPDGSVKSGRQLPESVRLSGRNHKVIANNCLARTLRKNLPMPEVCRRFERHPDPLMSTSIDSASLMNRPSHEMPARYFRVRNPELLIGRGCCTVGVI